MISIKGVDVSMCGMRASFKIKMQRACLDLIVCRLTMEIGECHTKRDYTLSLVHGWPTRKPIRGKIMSQRRWRSHTKYSICNLLTLISAPKLTEAKLSERKK